MQLANGTDYTPPAQTSWLQSTFGVGSAFSDFLANNPVTNFFTSVRDLSVDEARAKIRELYDTGLQFQALWNQLTALESTARSDPDLSAEYDSLMGRGSTVQSAISAAVAAAQNVVAFARETLGIDMSDVGTPPPGLGIVPLIPAAIIGAVVAAIALAAAWIVDARAGVDKLTQLQAVLAQVPADQRAAVASQALKDMGGPGFGSQIQKAVIWGAIGVAAIILLPTILKTIQSSRGPSQ